MYSHSSHSHCSAFNIQSIHCITVLQCHSGSAVWTAVHNGCCLTMALNLYASLPLPHKERNKLVGVNGIKSVAIGIYGTLSNFMVGISWDFVGRFTVVKGIWSSPQSLWKEKSREAGGDDCASNSLGLDLFQFKSHLLQAGSIAPTLVIWNLPIRSMHGCWVY